MPLIRPSKILLVQVGTLIPVLLPYPSFGVVCFLSFQVGTLSPPIPRLGCLFSFFLPLKY